MPMTGIRERILRQGGRPRRKKANLADWLAEHASGAARDSWPRSQQILAALLR